jgi:hypothetical protein
METDDMIRSCSGVVCCLRELADGKLRLVLDDVANDHKTTSGHWKHHILFTWKDFEAKEIDELRLSEKELASFGFSILARLVALRHHPIEKSHEAA